ncbi:arsenite efflux transporter metallochaperone ArsD [Kiritimatiellota bacterium B12222]|nr:arsenite efflux transporter metallochaperone ArsD [Kiritimatiellota bacterium B12222]
MKTLTIYDPPLCCSSGVCGPSVDPELVRVNADLEWLKSEGIEVTRFNLAQQPMDFAANEKVKTMLQEAGDDSLPLLFLDGHLIASRFYPTREQFSALFDLKSEQGCGCDAEGCCS